MITETRTDTQPPTLPVAADHAARWQRALMRAAELRIAITGGEHACDAFGIELMTYLVTSHSQPDVQHSVLLIRSKGEVTAMCSCPAGAVPIPCMHTALAIETAGWWPFDVHAQTEIEISDGNDLEPERPAPDPVQLAPAWFKIGQAVRPLRSRNTFWVRAVVAEPYGWVYELEDVARQPAGKFGESGLTLATVKRSRAA